MQKFSSSLSKMGALDAKSKLKQMKAQLLHKLILSHLNTNLIRNKFEALRFIIDINIDIFLTSETKLDDLFSTDQFLVKSLSASYRFNRNPKNDGLLLYVREEYNSNC